MAHKIVLVPLDERPCNYEFPYLLSRGGQLEAVRPPTELLGLKKRPAHTAQLWDWLERETEGASGIILSLDMLLYGGIVPSRLHHLDEKEIFAGIERLIRLKQRYPQVRIYAFQLIMRCPQYSLSDEEPDYYEDYGREIFRRGMIEHRLELGLASPEEEDELLELQKLIPPSVIDDYLERRTLNAKANIKTLEAAAQGWIDFLVFPQDDSAPYGYTARDQHKIREQIEKRNMELDVYMYPGADEVGCTLLARMSNKLSGTRPLVYPRMSSVSGAFVVPLYEDRMFYESVKYQVMAAGGLIASSAAEADLVLLLNTPGSQMTEASSQSAEDGVREASRNLPELIEYGEYAMRELGKAVAVADIYYANGSDLKLLKMLLRRSMLLELAGYAGWNTSSNTLGTTIAQSMLYLQNGRTSSHLDFLALRLTEDAGYCASVRQQMREQPIWDLFLLDGPRGKAAEEVRMRLNLFLKEQIDADSFEIEITDCFMPWNRLFEVGLSVRCVPRRAEPKVGGNDL